MSWLFGAPAPEPAPPPTVTKVSMGKVRITKPQPPPRHHALNGEAASLHDVAPPKRVAGCDFDANPGQDLKGNSEAITHLASKAAQASRLNQAADVAGTPVEDRIIEAVAKAVAKASEQATLDKERAIDEALRENDKKTAAAILAVQSEARLAQEKAVEAALRDAEERLKSERKAARDSVIDERVAQSAAQASAEAAAATDVARAEAKQADAKEVEKEVKEAEERVARLCKLELEALAETNLKDAVKDAEERIRAAVAQDYAHLVKQNALHLQEMQKGYADEKAVLASTHAAELQAAVAAAVQKAVEETEARLGSQYETTYAASALLMRQTEEKAARQMKEEVQIATAKAIAETEDRMSREHADQMKKVLVDERANSLAALNAAVNDAATAAEQEITMHLKTMHENEIQTLKQQHGAAMAAVEKQTMELEERLAVANRSIKVALSRILPQSLKEQEPVTLL